MENDNLVNSSFSDELLEFTKANQVEKERAIQSARSRGGGQKEVDKARKKTERRSQEAASPWKRVVIVRTTQDGKIRLIPRSDFQAGRHELLYGDAPGQPPKPEVTPNVAQEMASQDEFEASKTSNRLLGIINKKKQKKQEVVRSDHYDYPKDGVDKKDPNSTYPDWDHAPESLARGISLVANSTAGKQVDMKNISQFFGQSATLMDASIRAYQQFGEKIKGSFSVTVADEASPTTNEYKQFVGELDTPVTDLIIQDQEGKAYTVSFITDKTKIVIDNEADVLFAYSLQEVAEALENNEKTKKQLEKLKEKITKFITNTDTKNDIRKKYVYSNAEDFKREIISDLESILESNDDLERSIVLEALTGKNRFGEGSPAVANTLASTSRDGTNLKFVPLNDISINRLLGEVTLKLKLIPREDATPFDQMYMMMVNGQKQEPQLQEFFDILEDANDAKVFFDQVMSQYPSMLLGFLNLIDLTASNIIVSNINLDAIGSISNGDFTKVKVGDRTFYIDVEKEVEYYDSDALRLGEDVEQLSEGKKRKKKRKKKRNYKKEYREYHSKKSAKKRRAGRNAARRKAEKEGKVRKGDGKDIDHKDHNPLNNSNSNTRVRSRSANRGDNKVPVREEHGAGEEGTDELLLRYILDTPGQSIPRRLVSKRKK